MINGRIALFIPTFTGGGAERVTVYLANGLAERGYSVDMVLIKPTGPHHAMLSEKVRLVDLRASRVLYGILPLAKYLRAERPAILLAALEHATIGAYVARRLAGVAIPLISSSHSTLSQIVRHSGSLREFVVNRTISWFYRRVDAVVAVSRGVAEDMIRTMQLSAERVRVIYPILTPNIFSLAQVPVDHPWFAPGQPGVILAVGRLAPQKDFVTLLKAFALVQKHVPHRLLILGEGPQRSELEELSRNLKVTDRVALPGYSKNVFAYMARSSLFVLSSIFEAMPMVITEALAVGTPVVATDCQSGPREILRDGEYGLLVPPGNAEQLAQAMLETLAAPGANRRKRPSLFSPLVL